MLNLFVLNENFTGGFKYNILILLSILSIFCAILVIISKNPVVSVLFLIGLFFTISLYLMVIGISFIGLSYLLVYVGAVSILFLFILMLINVRISELVTDNNNSVPLSIITILIFSFIFNDKLLFSNINTSNTALHYINTEGLHDNYTFFSATGNGSIIKQFSTYLSSSQEMGSNDSVYFGSSYTWDSALTEMSHITSIGNILYTRYPMLLLTTSIILLLAMVGAIVITLKN